MTYWTSSGQGGVSFSSIERIEGNFRIDPARKLNDGGGGFSKLSYVGGNFELIGDPTYGEIWNLQTWYDWGGGIKHIGGDLCLTKIQLQSEWFGRISRVGIYRR